MGESPYSTLQEKNEEFKPRVLVIAEDCALNINNVESRGKHLMKEFSVGNITLDQLKSYYDAVLEILYKERQEIEPP